MRRGRPIRSPQSHIVSYEHSSNQVLDYSVQVSQDSILGRSPTHCRTASGAAPEVVVPT